MVEQRRGDLGAAELRGVLAMGRPFRDTGSRPPRSRPRPICAEATPGGHRRSRIERHPLLQPEPWRPRERQAASGRYAFARADIGAIRASGGRGQVPGQPGAEGDVLPAGFVATTPHGSGAVGGRAAARRSVRPARSARRPRSSGRRTVPPVQAPGRAESRRERGRARFSRSSVLWSASPGSVYGSASALVKPPRRGKRTVSPRRCRRPSSGSSSASRIAAAPAP